MPSMDFNWEDEETNRIVEFVVDYNVDDDSLAIGTLSPTKVTFCRNGSVRSIGVHTGTGRRMLADQFRCSTAFERLCDELTQPLAV